MKVKMLVSMAGRDFSHQPCDIVNVTKEIASAWQNANIAAIIQEERAVKRTPEKAVKRKKK